MIAGAVPGTAILVLLGPTGTGKTDVALELARRLDGEVVGCDSLQVYRALNAATGKPGAGARRAVRHHLIDCVDPRVDCSMADYVRAADAAIAGLTRRGRVPLVVGGTGLYLRGLLRGFVDAPARDPALRDRLRRVVERGGLERLRAWLVRADAGSAARIPAGDVQRLIRAIELVRSGGGNWSERMRESGGWSEAPERYAALKVGLDMEREAHGGRLDSRVDQFFEAGLVQEIQGLLARGVPRTANALKAIGYREVLEALDRGEPGDAPQVRERVRRSTRRYARRQRTWFRGETGVSWLDASRPKEELASQIARLWLDRADGRG